MFYRVLQFTHAFFPYINPEDIKWALNHLSPEASILFLQQSLPDQRHAIHVTQSIVKAKHPLSNDNFINLVTAALLHDCGKSVITIRLWHRVFIVLIQKIPQSVRVCLESGQSILSIPLKVDTRHAIWGGYLAEQAGLDPEICRLIRDHHNPKTDLGYLLKQADNEN